MYSYRPGLMYFLSCLTQWSLSRWAFWQLNMMQLYTPEVKAVEEVTSFTYFVISHISGHVLLERWMWDGGRCMFMVDLKGMLHEFGYHI